MRPHPALLRRLVQFTAGVVIVSALGSAQCLDWKTGFGSAGANGDVQALCVFDDGDGPALYAGGVFDAVGATNANAVAKWNGTAWSPLGSGVAMDAFDRGVFALAVFDDGSGDALYAAGTFTSVGGVAANHVAKWDGRDWHALGTGLAGTPGVVPKGFALCVYDDGLGGGPALYVGGEFQFAGGAPANNIARWNGTSWSSVSTGADRSVRALAVFDDGNGRALYAGGDFFAPGLHLARWNGVAWSAVGSMSAFGSTVRALRVFDDGSGVALYVGGVFPTIGSVTVNNVARFDGTTFSALGAGTTPGVGFALNGVHALHAFDDGSGPALYAGGLITSAGGAPASNVAKWNGAAWSSLAGGVSGGGETGVRALASFSAPSFGGPDLVAGGTFADAGGASASRIARYDGAAWARVADGNGVSGWLNAITVFDDGAGPALYVGGGFAHVGGGNARGVAKWSGSSWSPLGTGIPGEVLALAVHDDGSGPALYAGGHFNQAGGVPALFIARWDGVAWSDVGGGATSGVRAFAVFDDGTGAKLCAAGGFAGLGISGVAEWDGSSWSPLGSGMNGTVAALTVYDDGNGRALYAAGTFNDAGGTPANSIARWNGATWSALGTGLKTGPSTAQAYALTTFEPSGGTRDLYVGGFFNTAGGLTANGIARWDGSQWHALAPIDALAVTALQVFDDGTGQGPALYAGGVAFAAPASSSGVGRYDGAVWTPLGVGLGFPVSGSIGVKALGVFDDGTSGGADLYVGGGFSHSGGEPSTSIAEWRGCGTPPGVAFCFGDGSLATPCPCAPPDTVPNPPAAPGHGCANSFHLGGARLFGTGTTNPDSVVIHGEDLTPGGFALFFVGTAEDPNGIAFADGVRCVAGSLLRFGGQFATPAGTVAYPNPPLGLTLSLSTLSGTTPGSGLTKRYQVFYRNALPGFCTPGTTNYTSGYRVTW